MVHTSIATCAGSSFMHIQCVADLHLTFADLYGSAGNSLGPDLLYVESRYSHMTFDSISWLRPSAAHDLLKQGLEGFQRHVSVVCEA